MRTCKLSRNFVSPRREFLLIVPFVSAFSTFLNSSRIHHLLLVLVIPTLDTLTQPQRIASSEQHCPAHESLRRDAGLCARRLVPRSALFGQQPRCCLARSVFAFFWLGTSAAFRPIHGTLTSHTALDRARLPDVVGGKEIIPCFALACSTSSSLAVWTFRFLYARCCHVGKSERSSKTLHGSVFSVGASSDDTATGSCETGQADVEASTCRWAASSYTWRPFSRRHAFFIVVFSLFRFRLCNRRRRSATVCIAKSALRQTSSSRAFSSSIRSSIPAALFSCLDRSTRNAPFGGAADSTATAASDVVRAREPRSAQSALSQRPLLPLATTPRCTSASTAVWNQWSCSPSSCFAAIRPGNGESSCH